MRTLISFWIALILLTVGTIWCAAHATDYFVDFQSPGVEDGLAPGTAWLSGKTALANAYAAGGGHTIWCKPSHHEIATSDWTVTSDGVAGDPITIRTDLLKEHWPGSTGTTASFTTAGFEWVFYQDNYWCIRDLVFQDNTSISGDLSIDLTTGMQIIGCEFYDTAANFEQVRILRSSVSIDGCTFNGQNQLGVGAIEGDALALAYGYVVHVSSSSFDGYSDAIESSSGGGADFIDCVFGGSEANIDDFSINEICRITLHDCDMAATTSTMFAVSRGPDVSYVTSYYRDPQDRATGLRYGNGYTLVSKYDLLRSGGADWSIGCSATTANVFASYSSARIPVLEYAVDCAAAESRDYSIYAYRSEGWAAVPTADQLYMEVIYQGEVGGADRVASKTSTETLDTAKTWTALTCTGISPFRAGPVLISVYLGINDTDTDGAGDDIVGSIYVDPKLITSTTETYNPTYQYGLPLAGYVAPAAAAGGGQIILIGEAEQKAPTPLQWVNSMGGGR